MSSTAMSAAKSLSEKVEGRIRDTFMELLPEDTFRELVESALNNLTQKRVDNHFGRSEVKPSVLEEMIQSELRGMIKDRLAVFMDEQCKPTPTGDGEYVFNEEAFMSKFLKDYLDSNLQNIFREVVTSMMQTSLVNVTQNLRNEILSSGSSF